MMSTIYKYPLKRGHHTIKVPVNSQPLMIEVQNNQPHIWLEVCPTERMVEVDIRAYETGEPLTHCHRGSWRYLGSVFLDDDTYVLHYYVNFAGIPTS